MLRATWRGLLAHKVRLLLTAVAVVLGVAFVCGSLVFTDTLKKTFDDLFTQTSPDVVVTPRSAFTGQQDQQNGSLTLPASDLQTVGAVDGVRRTQAEVFVNGVQVVGKDGKVLGQPGVPAFGANWTDDPDLSPFRLVEGRGPTRAGEVDLDTQTASKAGLTVGDTVELTTPSGTRHDRIVGLFRFGTSGNLAGASITAFDLRTAQAVLLDGADAYTQISAKAAPGISQEELKARVVAALGPQAAATTQVQTGKAAADERAKQITDNLAFFNVFLLVFAGIALVVGSFIILNTFSMLVAQRTRELALLRALGASRRQVRRSVLVEAFAVGVVGSTVGLGLGILLSLGLRGLFSALGIDFPAGSLVVSGRTVVVAYAVGVLVTLLAAYLPARRASRVAPMAALRVDARPTTRALRTRTIVGIVLLVLGAVQMLAGVRSTGGSAPSLVGLGALLVLVAAIVLSPALSRPVIGFLGRPLLRRATGRIAVDNARRNPRRTASTASALMIGLALVSAIGVLGASTTASTDAVIDDVVKADFIATNVSFLPLPPDVAAAIEGVDGVGTVSRVQAMPARLTTGVTELTVVDPKTISSMLSIDMVAGTLEGLGTNGLVVDKATATSEHLKLGSRIPATFESGRKATLVVEGIYQSSGAFSGGVVSTSTAREAGARDADVGVYVRLAPGADVEATRASLDKAMKAYPNVKLLDQTEFKQSISDQINQLLYVVYALLALAVLIAVLGIVNTLALSVVERTREIGLLRALGMDRRQLRTTVRLESVAIAVFGALLGLAVGLSFGVALQRSLRDQGITVLGIPWTVLVVVLVLSVLVGVLAAVWPARRAAKLDVLAAITTE